MSFHFLLSAADDEKADDMAAKSYFAHTSPEGIDPWHWFAQVGYKFTYAGENLAVHQAIEPARVVENRKNFLHAAQREDRNQEGAAALNRVVHRRDQPGDLVDPLLARGALGDAARRLHDERVEMAGGKLGAF